LEERFRINPVIGLLGPRQAGKSTIARQFAGMVKEKGQSVAIFDLEKNPDLAALQDPYTTLRSLRGLVIIDEIQRVPDLFKTLRVLVDEGHRDVRYLVLGSASRDLIHQSSETLAGRISYIELMPFSLEEAGTDSWETLWRRGGLPLSYLATSDDDSAAWRQDYIRTFLERDIPALGIQIPPASLRRFWMMLTHVHGQMLNASDIGRSLGISDHTVRRYLDILSGTYMMRVLPPWHENIKKRQVKSPKVFFRDSGILHSLLGLTTQDDLLHHPKMGNSWEGFALEETIRQTQPDPENVYFWSVHNQADLDLLIFKGGKRLGFEIKYTDTPTVTRSMHTALEDLKLDSLTIVHPGDRRFSLAERIEAVGLTASNRSSTRG